MPRMIGRLSPVNIVLGFTLAFTHTPSTNSVIYCLSWIFHPSPLSTCYSGRV
ncbi:hypothetical protein GBAR_LOCUS14670, partial [Geodia barretti]